MKIAIVNPPFNPPGRWGIRAGSRWPFTGTTFNPSYTPYPHSMGYPASYLMERGQEVLFYDAVGWRHDALKMHHIIRSFEPDFVIQEISYPSINLDLRIAQSIAEYSKVVLAGTHASVDPEWLASQPYIHAVFQGPYEEHALKLAETRMGGIYPRGPLENLDKYPWPWRDNYMKNDSRSGFAEYTNAYTMYYDPCCGGTPEPMLTVLMSRGCPFKCNFCLWPNVLYDNHVKWRDIGNVLEEIEYFVSEEGYKSVYFDDDTQNACGWTRMKELCDGMKEIGVPWLLLGRLDLNTEDEFMYMIEHGCSGMRLGIESLSQRLLDRMNKGLKTEDIVKKIEFLKNKTNLYLLFMHGFPGESEADVSAQNEYIEKLGIRHQNPVCIPFPGTPYYNSIASAVPAITGVDPLEFDGNNLSTRLLEVVKHYARHGEEHNAQS